MRRLLAVTTGCTLLIPASSFAKVDASCSTTTATSAVTGRVQDALGRPLQGMRVELYETNRNIPTKDSAVTDRAGRYRICAGEVSGAGHNTYDVHVRDLALAPRYATANQPYTTYTSPATDADFTPASGHPVLYMLNLTITPNGISTLDRAVPVTWLVRSKAPAPTNVILTLGHRKDEQVRMVPAPPEAGGPEAGGWNRWQYSETIAANSVEKLYWSSARGFDGTVAVTELDRQPYSVDNTPPLLGPADTGIGSCGPGVPALPFSPASPPGTTNRMPVVTHGACDHWSNGARTGLDPFSLAGAMCRDVSMTAGCSAIRPVLNANSIVWYPPDPLPLGDYYFRWRIADFAGNVTESPTAHRLSIVERGGQVPLFTAVQPGNVGSGNTSGVIVGSSITSPSSYPFVGFRVLDADGQRDLVPGSLRVRVYYGDERTLVYDYDPFTDRNAYDPVTKKGGALFDLSTGAFRADGYPLQGKPPGRYVASAQITDAGGNSATITWHWVLAAAV